MSKEAMKLALEGAANYIDALGGDSRKYRQALAEKPAQPSKLTVTLEDRPIDIELAQYKRMFEAACSALGQIGDALGCDPEEGGAEPILAAIAELKAEQPAQQQEPVAIGEPVGWHSKQYGFVYMALQPHQFEVGSTLCLKNGTPAWRIESSCSMTALISMSSLPHGTVFYTSPPAQRKPLTDEEIKKAVRGAGMLFTAPDLRVARAIEAAHGIK